MSDTTNSNNAEDHNFFSRWSKRKQAVKQGVPVVEPLQTANSGPLLNPSDATPQPHAASSSQTQPSQEPVKALTLEDVSKLTQDSDFSAYMTQGVSPEVRNAAMKKLLADPHYNIMDGLDIYIGDYNTPDPLPEGMLAKMVGAQFLGLVKAPEDVAQSAPTSSSAPLENDSAPHDHTHLRLQPDDAPADPATGPVTG